MRIRLRKAEKDDIVHLDRLFQETVRTVNAVDYSLEETEDWASCGNGTERWETLVDSLYFVVAEVVEQRGKRVFPEPSAVSGPLVGFAAVSGEGYLHSMFVHKDYQRCGIARILLQDIEQYARLQGVDRLFSEVSLTARPFFEKEGYGVVKEQRRRARELELKNFVMEKKLDKSDIQ